MPKHIALTPELAAALDHWLRTWNVRTNVYYYATLRATWDRGAEHVTTLTIEDGLRYVRVWSATARERAHGDRGSAYAFVDKQTGPTFGDVLKPDGWKKPAKGARGNLLRDLPTSIGGPHGVGYIVGPSMPWPKVVHSADATRLLIAMDALAEGKRELSAMILLGLEPEIPASLGYVAAATRGTSGHLLGHEVASGEGADASAG